MSFRPCRTPRNYLLVSLVSLSLAACGSDSSQSVPEADGIGGAPLAAPAQSTSGSPANTLSNGGTPAGPAPEAGGASSIAGAGGAAAPTDENNGGLSSGGASVGGQAAGGGSTMGGAGGAGSEVPGTGPYIEKDGLVIIEVENAGEAAGWTLKTEHMGYSGAGYYEWTEADRRQGTDPLQLAVRIASAGEYQIHIYSHQAAGVAWDASNDLFLRVPGTGVIEGFADLNEYHKTYVGSSEDHILTDRDDRMAARQALVGDWRFWIWTEEPRRVPRAQFEAGLYAIELAGRSQGFSIDRVVLALAPQAEQPDAEETQAWLSAAESEREP